MAFSKFAADFAGWLESEKLGYTHQVYQDFDQFFIAGGRQDISVICVSLEGWVTSGGNHPLSTYPDLPDAAGTSFPVILWEDTWYRKTAIVQSRLQALRGVSVRISARKTLLERIDKPTADRFLDAHHINGAAAARYRFGLFLPRKYFADIPAQIHQDNPEKVLVAVAAFAAPKTFYRQDKPYKSGELIHFASYSGTTVTGGLTKLINHFARQYRPDDIMTYVDREWSNGPSFRKSGFEPAGQTEPLFFMVDTRSFARYPLFKFDNKILYGPGSEKLVKIQNAGNLKYIKEFTFPPFGREWERASKKPPATPPYDIIFVVGPTASGKTDLAVRIAYELGGEIISLDSRQVYRKMDLGTGKDLETYQIEEIKIPYHLIDIVDPGTPYTIHQFKQDFSKAYEALQKKGRPVIACGGSGLYIEAVLNLLGSGFPAPNCLIIALNPPAEARKARIEKRLEARLEAGLVEEVKSLLESGVPPATLINYGLEYKYVTFFLQGKLTHEEMVRALLPEIHRFSKRQLTFLRKIERSGYTIHWMQAP